MQYKLNIWSNVFNHLKTHNVPTHCGCWRTYTKTMAVTETLLSYFSVTDGLCSGSWVWILKKQQFCHYWVKPVISLDLVLVRIQAEQNHFSDVWSIGEARDYFNLQISPSRGSVNLNNYPMWKKYFTYDRNEVW